MISKIVACPLPSNSIIQSSFPAIDYDDAFIGNFSFLDDLSIEECVHAFFESAPNWVRKLIGFRDTLVRIFGLKSSGVINQKPQEANFKVEVGNGLGLFKIIEKSDREVMMGEDDKHLNFRVSLLLTREDNSNNYNLTIATAVKMKNLWGKLYFLPVKPIHKLIVPVMLRGIIRHLQNQVSSR